MAAEASSSEAQSKTPLPRAKPSALTAHLPLNSEAKRLAGPASPKLFERGVGMPCHSMKSWEKALDDSNCAACRLGTPNAKPVFLKQIDDPQSQGIIRPDDGQIDPLFGGEGEQGGRSSAAMFRHCASEPLEERNSAAMPALPGAHHKRLTRGDCASFQTKACSRPPEPMTRIFTRWIEAGRRPLGQRVQNPCNSTRAAAIPCYICGLDVVSQMLPHKTPSTRGVAVGQLNLEFCALKLQNERLVLLLLAAIQFTTNLDFLIILPLGPQYMRVMHITPAQFNLIVAAYAIAAGISGVVRRGFSSIALTARRPCSGSSWGSPRARSCARWLPPTAFWSPPAPLPALSAA